jgi:hypothetical protein
VAVQLRWADWVAVTRLLDEIEQPVMPSTNADGSSAAASIRELWGSAPHSLDALALQREMRAEWDREGGDQAKKSE